MGQLVFFPEGKEELTKFLGPNFLPKREGILCPLDDHYGNWITISVRRKFEKLFSLQQELHEITPGIRIPRWNLRSYFFLFPLGRDCAPKFPRNTNCEKGFPQGLLGIFHFLKPGAVWGNWVIYSFGKSWFGGTGLGKRKKISRDPFGQFKDIGS